jgi:hypothetical protein
VKESFVRAAIRLIIFTGCMMVISETFSTAQESSAAGWINRDEESRWLPERLVSPNLAEISSFESDRVSSEFRFPGTAIRGQSGDVTNSSPDASYRSAKSGTGMDSLPSFRGMKGIRNLPGGVGTLLMANPHVGGSWYPEQGTDQPGTTLSMNRLDFQGAVPLYSSGRDTYVLTSDVEILSVNTNAILPTTQQPFPNRFFNLALGVNYFHQFEDDKVGGIVFEMGSASNKPFDNSRDLLISGTGFLLIPNDEKGSWFVGVNLSTNSQVLHGLPIPGGGYFFHPSDDFQAIVGLPFSVISWKPSRDWQLQFVYAFLTTTHARVSYQPTQKWQWYAGFDWTNENWDRAERVDEQDRFFYYEKKLSTGVLWWIKPNVGFEVATGWAFDRYFTEVDNGFNLVGDNTVNVNSGPYATTQLSLRF